MKKLLFIPLLLFITLTAASQELTAWTLADKFCQHLNCTVTFKEAYPNKTGLILAQTPDTCNSTSLREDMKLFIHYNETVKLKWDWSQAVDPEFIGAIFEITTNKDSVIVRFNSKTHEIQFMILPWDNDL